MPEYFPTIGIECHVQLKTKTKLFAAVSNDARGAEPNTLISHICVGMPGALPVLNEAAVELASRAAFALGTSPQKFSKFDRKHYFYPDLPKGYQISQYEQPIIIGGFVEIQVAGQIKKIGITRAHLEEDAGKNTHPEGADYSLVDLNRAGTPLLEIVSEPEIHSASEAKAYVRELYLLMKYSGVSDCDLYHGNMRFDVNISVSKNPEKLGTRSEVKNLNSFRSVENAVNFEINRQIEVLESGERVIQETRGWDENNQKTFSQRSKEESQDYRYMPEPDVPPVILSNEYIDKIKRTEPVLPSEYRNKLKKLGIDELLIETLLENQVEFENVDYIGLIYEIVENPEKAKTYANWSVNIEAPARREGKITRNSVDKTKIYKEIYSLQKSGKLSSGSVKELLLQLLSIEVSPNNIEEYAEENGFIQVSDESEIEKIVEEVLRENSKAAEDVKKGEMKAIGFLVGQVMKKSAGKANPSITQEIIKKQLNS